MAYTVKQLASLSGVSARTLRFYDKIDLLSPAYYADNGYRYYEQEQLLLLQQILFFRELGYKLQDIKVIITADEFNQLNSLKAHKQQLQNTLSNTKNLITTIDKTIAHLQGEIQMKETELYLAFKHPKQLAMVDYLNQQMGPSVQKLIDECQQKIATLKPEDVEVMQKETEVWCQQFKNAIEQKLSPCCDTVQQLAQQYYTTRVECFCKPSKDEFVQMVEVAIKQPDYREYLDEVHKDFADYFLSAITIFANKNLGKR